MNISYDNFRDVEKTIGPIEEKVIYDTFIMASNGNGHFEEMDRSEYESSLWAFRHGWIFARAAIELSKKVV